MEERDVDQRIREQIKPLKQRMETKFDRVWEKYDDLYQMSLKSNIYLEQIAKNTADIKEDYQEIKQGFDQYGPRIDSLEGQHELKKINIEGKWKVAVAFVSGTSILGLIITALLTWFGGFPLQ